MMKHWHIGILTLDIDKTLDFFCSVPGANRESWTLGEVEFSSSEMIVGDGGKLRTAMGRLDGIVYELIQPMDNGSYHAQKLKARGPGLHHSAYICEENQDEIVAAVKATGGRVVWEVQHGNEHAYYLESSDGGTVWEIINCCPFMPEEE